MRLDVGQAMAGLHGERGGGADLVGDEPLGFDLAHRQHAATEADPVGEAGMGADSHAVLACQREGFGHDDGVAGMEAAGDVATRDDAEHRPIVAHDVDAETFAAIAVEVDSRHVGPSGARRSA